MAALVAMSMGVVGDVLVDSMVDEVDQPIVDCIANVLADQNFDFGPPDGNDIFDALGDLLIDARCVYDCEHCLEVQVRHNKFLSPRALREHIKNIEKTTLNSLQESMEALCLQHPKSDEKHDNMQLWWAGKELAMDKKLSDYVGTNDKTKDIS